MNIDYFEFVATIATIACSGATIGIFILDVLKLVIDVLRERQRRDKK